LKILKVERLIDSYTYNSSVPVVVPSINLGQTFLEFHALNHLQVSNNPALMYINGETVIQLTVTNRTVIKITPILVEADIDAFLDLLGIESNNTNSDSSESTATTDTSSTDSTTSDNTTTSTTS